MENLSNLRQKFSILVMSLLNKVFLFVAILLLGAYVGANIWLFSQKNTILYPDVQDTSVYFFAERLPHNRLKYDKIELTSAYGNVETCIFPSFAKKNVWLIYLHHTHNLYYSDTNLWRYKIWNNLGINTITLNYIKDNTSDNKVAYSEKMYQSALVAYNYLVDILEVPEDKILVYGEGFGAYPASKLAQEMPVGALVLENMIRSQKSFLKDFYPILLTPYLIEEDLEVTSYLSKMNKNLLFIHFQNHNTPNYYDVTLYEKSKNDYKKILYIGGDDVKLNKKNLRSYQKGMADLLKQLKLRKI
ncbi:MAG: hypothetical protein SFU27_04855 [Thermonemataceae bacterium]|nr:hypothetical protein [Thermonemataceae bacterium]